MNNLAESKVEDTDALRYKIINNFKWPYKKPDTIVLSNEMRVCRTDDGGDAFSLKMDEHPYIDSLERKIGISFITKDEYYTLIDSICKHKFNGNCPEDFISSFTDNKLFGTISAFLYEKDTSIIVYERFKNNVRPFSRQYEYQKDKAGKWILK